jgi:hypothetical protein
MNQTLRGLIQIPLQMAHQTGAVVDDEHDHGCDPFALACQNLARAVVKVQVSQGVDVIDLKAAHLQTLQAVPGRQCPCAGAFGTVMRKSETDIPPSGGGRALKRYQLPSMLHPTTVLHEVK